MELRQKDSFHGSDLEKVEAVYGLKKEEIRQFASNVNPLGPPPSLLTALADSLGAVATYPDRDYRGLREAIASYAGTVPEDVVPGNGTSDLISLFIQLKAPKKALIVGPTYSEYARAVELAGGQVAWFPLREEEEFRLDLPSLLRKISDRLDLLVLCNPNNPTGTVVSREDLRQVLNACMEHGLFVLVDETYMEFAEDVARATAIPLARYYDNLLVLRGTSKFFAAPGLRLGYGITGNKDLRERLLSRETPWAVHSLADAAAPAMFRDRAYQEETRELISRERERLFARFSSSSRFRPFPPGANFMLLKILEPGLTAGDLFDRCMRQGRMIRDCGTFPFLSDRFLRFCFLQPEENDRLAELLER